MRAGYGPHLGQIRPSIRRYLGSGVYKQHKGNRSRGLLKLQLLRLFITVPLAFDPVIYAKHTHTHRHTQKHTLTHTHTDTHTHKHTHTHTHKHTHILSVSH